MRPEILNPLFAALTDLKGVGPQLAKPLTRLGLERVVDVLFHLPTGLISRFPVERLDLAKIGKLEFRAPDEARWPALRLARAVMRMRGLAGAAFNAAKETALDAFIARQIRFTDMAAVVEEVLNALDGENALKCERMRLEDVLETDHLARIRAAETAARMTMDA